MAAATHPVQPARRRLKTAWITDYPVEWLADLPPSLRSLRRQHPATWARVLLEEFQRRGDVEVHVIVLRGRVKESVVFQQHGTTYHVLKVGSLGRLLSLFWLDTRLIRRQLERIQPDLVHAWGTERAAALVASRLDQPYLVTLQGLLTWVVRAVPSIDLYTKFMALLEPLALRRARVATSESRFSMDYLGRRYPQLQLHQAEHAPNRVFFHTERSTPTGGINILAIGTLGPGKGTDLLLAALDELRDEFKFEVLFIGDCTPTLMKSLCRRTSPELWARVQFQRRLTPEEVAAALSRTTLLAHPTRADNSPNAVKEAAVMGVPVVASNVGGIPDYITHGQNGLLFPAGDEQSLTRALREAMTHPMFSRGQVDPSSWSKVREDLSPQRMGERFFEAYQLVLNAWGKT